MIFNFKRDYPNKYPHEVKPGEEPYKLEIVWRNVAIFIFIHYTALKVFLVPVQPSTFWLGKFLHKRTIN